MEMSKGPWTPEEDSKLTNYVAIYGEGHWTSLSRSAGLKRSGKSCRLRWLNYLKPNVRRGNISLEEQLLIIQLNLQFGNRWSKIAKHLPGRTDNDIKNYWRTKVKKLAKQLKCDVTSQKFKDTLQYVWMPRLVEQIHFTSFTSSQASTAQPITTVDHNSSTATGHHPTTELSHALVDSSFKTEDSSISDLTNSYDLLGKNWPSDDNSIQDVNVYGLDSVAAHNSYGLGDREAIEESNSLLSGEDWLELFPECNYNGIWEDQQIIYTDQVHLN